MLAAVVVAQGPVAGGQVLVARGAAVVPGLAGSDYFGIGPDDTQRGVECAESG